MDTKGKLSDRIYTGILGDIMDGKYTAGQILNEQELCNLYQCSKSPVRAALLLLCQEDILRCIPRYGYEINRMSVKYVEDILNIRYLLEGGMVRASLQNFTENQVNILESILCKSNDATLKIGEQWDINAAFHLQLMSFCKNDYARSALEVIMKKLKMSYVQFYQEDQNHGVSEYSFNNPTNHSAMIQCLRNKDTETFLQILKNGLSHFANKQFDILDCF